MNVIDLRVGNYIYLDNEIIKIGRYTLSSLLLGNYPFNVYKPIPLSEEMLIKLGFFKNGMSYKRNSVPMSLYKRFYNNEIDKEFTLFIGIQPICKVEYVHQLQNLYFYASGSELDFYYK